MKQMARFLVVLAMLATGWVAGGPAMAKDVKCSDIDTEVVGTVDFATNTVDGTVLGNGILKDGMAHGEFAFTSVDPEAGTATFEGTYVVTTKKGSISFDLSGGVIDLTTLQGYNDSLVTGGTGKFEGATGGLFFVGGVDAGGGFVDAITGTICLSKNKS